MPSRALRDAPGSAAAGGEEGRESGMVRPPPTSGRGGAGLQTAESNGRKVKKPDRERWKVRTHPARPRKEKGAKWAQAKRGTKRERAGKQGRNWSFAKRLKEGWLRRAERIKRGRGRKVIGGGNSSSPSRVRNS